jgi:Tol biopolymer transport system component
MRLIVRFCTSVTLFCIAPLLLLSGCSKEGEEEIQVEKIVFRSDRTGNWEIFIANPDGTDLKQLTYNDSSDVEPSLAPDGHIAFHSNRDGDYEIYSMNVDGSNVVQLTDNSIGDTHAEWSPDGQRIVYESSYDIFIMNRDGSEQTNLTNTPESEYWAKWSPDGTKVVFCKNVDGQFDIYIMDSDGSGAVQITNDPARDTAPAWSPDGSMIAYCSRLEPFSYNYQISTMNIDGSNITQITDGYWDNEPVWSPDGSRIIFTRLRGYNDIVIINMDGSGELNLTESTWMDTCPDWKLIRIKKEATGFRVMSWK